MKFKKINTVILAVIFLINFSGCGTAADNKSVDGGTTADNAGIDSGTTADNQDISNTDNEDIDKGETMLLYQGHASLRLTSKDGTVIYIDPAVGDGYDLPADIILVTHEHSDHNQVNLITQKEDCVVIRVSDAILNGEHNTFTIKGIEIEAVEAYNSNHSKNTSVGFLILIDGIMIYVAGDTSKTEQMETLSERHIDYAFLPCDGVYNMNAEDAAEYAKLIGAKNNIPYHTRNMNDLFSSDVAERFDAPNKLIIEPGEEIILSRY